MRISRSDRDAGQPIKRVRDFLRRLGFWAWSKPAIAEFFEVAPSRADVIIKEMLVTPAAKMQYKFDLTEPEHRPPLPTTHLMK